MYQWALDRAEQHMDKDYPEVLVGTEKDGYWLTDRTAVILANGPSLTKEAVTDACPTGNELLIGVNRSQSIAWAPILCSAHPTFDPKYFISTELQPIVNVHYRDFWPRPPVWASPSGCFAMWYAVEILNFKYINLVGFWGEDHFYERGNPWQRA